MSNQSLSLLVLDVLKNNRKVGKAIVKAYRAGGTRLVNRQLPGALGQRGEKVTHFLANGIGRSSDVVDVTLDKIYSHASKAVEKVAAAVDGVENPYATKYFDLVTSLTLPGARIARDVSGKVAARTGKIHGRTGKSHGRTVKKVARKVVRKIVKKGRAAKAAA
jgi:hypothetical protein